MELRRAALSDVIDLSGGLSVESGARLWSRAGWCAGISGRESGAGRAVQPVPGASAPADVAISYAGRSPPWAQPARPNVLPTCFRARAEGVEELETRS